MLVGIIVMVALPTIARWADTVIGAGESGQISTSGRNGTLSGSHGPFTDFSETYHRENFGPDSGVGITPSMRILTSIEDTLTVLFLLTVGCCYKSLVTNRRTQLPYANLPSGCSLASAPHDFHASCLSCGGNLSICAWSCLAWSVRMGDTYHAAGVTNFWTPLAVYVGARIGALIIGTIPGMVGGVPTFSMKIMQAFFFARWRQALRERLGAPAVWSSRVFVKDALLYIFLPFCLIAQEAQTVDRAAGTRVVCCTIQDSSYLTVEDAEQELVN